MELYQTKKSLHSKKKISKTKSQSAEWAKMCPVTKNRESLQLNIKQTIQFKTWAQDLNIHFSKDIQLANRHMEKILAITNHQGNANENCNNISPHTCQNGCYQKDNK